MVTTMGLSGWQATRSTGATYHKQLVNGGGLWHRSWTGPVMRS
jgi:hypothetical protein